MKETFRTAEVAQHYGVSTQTIRNYCNNGKIPPSDFYITQGKRQKTYRFFPSVFDRLKKNDIKIFVNSAVQARNKKAKARLRKLVS